MNNPLLKDALQFEPLHVFKTAKKLMHVYSEWQTRDMAWKMQVHVDEPDSPLCSYATYFHFSDIAF